LEGILGGEKERELTKIDQKLTKEKSPTNMYL